MAAVWGACLFVCVCVTYCYLAKSLQQVFIIVTHGNTPQRVIHVSGPEVVKCGRLYFI